jgi:drug/metabolite transporter (DMT)-like permease
MSWLGPISHVGMIVFGTGSSVTMKIMLGFDAAGWAGIRHKFDKPFMQSLLMFFGMAFSLLIGKFWDPEGKAGAGRVQASFRQKVMVAVPCAFDLIASTLMTFGLIWINASIFQMLRGSMVIFSAVFSIVFLKKRIIPAEWFGICLVIVALVIIGLSAVWMPSGDDGDSADSATTGQKLAGALLVIAAQIVQAAQIVVEQFVLHDLSMPALEVVGWEVIWGFVMMILLAFPFALIVPGKDPSPLGNSLENFIDSFMQLAEPKVAGICVGFIIAVLGLNMFGMLVTSHTNAINRTLMEAARTILVWIVMLIAFAAGWGFGEPWSKWSWLELSGFIILVCGTVIYNKIWKFPFFVYPEPPTLTQG